MKTPEQIAELAKEKYPKHNKDGSLNFSICNRVHQEDGYTQAQEDMSKEAIKFAEWMCKEGYDSKQVLVSPTWSRGIYQPSYSSEELYQLFLKSKEKL